LHQQSFPFKGYWHQRADERHGNPPQGNLELLVVKRQSWKTPGELGVIKSMDCVIFFPSVLDTVGWATGRACSL